MTQKFQVAIAGGGIAGLITAIALLQHPGVEVRVYERAGEFKEIGASIGLGPNGLRSLEALGVDTAFAEDISQRQKSGWPMVYRHWKTEEVIGHDEHHLVKNKKHFTARFHRAHLHRALLEKVPGDVVRLGKKTVDVKTSDEGATLFFEDGTSASADVVIGADGIHSAVRKTFVPGHTLRWTGWVALRATFEASRLEGVEYPEDAVHWVSGCLLRKQCSKLIRAQIGHERNFFHSRLGMLSADTDIQ